MLVVADIGKLEARGRAIPKGKTDVDQMLRTTEVRDFRDTIRVEAYMYIVHVHDGCRPIYRVHVILGRRPFGPRFGMKIRPAW